VRPFPVLIGTVYCSGLEHQETEGLCHLLWLKTFPIGFPFGLEDFCLSNVFRPECSRASVPVDSVEQFPVFRFGTRDVAEGL